MIYFITENYLKTQTPITANVDVTDVTPYIKTQSDMRVQPILGTYFYNYMLTGYNAQTLNNDEETLVTQKASFYEARLFRFLKENKDLFPEFISDLNKDSDIRPSKKEDTGYTTQILIL